MDSVYQQVGGDDYFFGLVDRFYLGVAGDPVLRPLYPDDLTEARRHLALFLVQYWGGPDTYNQERGHPRLRMRHAPFVIGALERDAWLRHMTEAVEHGPELPPAVRRALLEYFAMAAGSLTNAR